MITICQNSKVSYQCLGTQDYHPWSKYKELPYILKLNVPGSDRVIWYNLLTREIVLLLGSEMDAIDRGSKNIISLLVHSWFYIPEDMDAKTLVYFFNQRFSTLNPIKQGSPLTLATIFTTTFCNAKCEYCYEYGTSKNTMSTETAEAAAEYIIKHAGPRLLIKWFGGEPLMNIQVMDIISEKIHLAGIESASHITTNGYLLDKVTDEQLKKVWNVSQIQITIDGTKNVYQQTKGLPDDAYDKALSSIERLAKIGINVMVRMHVTDNNLDDLKHLVTELSDRYRPLGNLRKYIRIYATPLFDFGPTAKDMFGEKRKQIFDNYIEIDQMIFKSGIDHGRGVKAVQNAHCMADNGKSVVIAPTGDITPCEHYHDREIIGNVWEGVKQIPQKWIERAPEKTECAECFNYPQCIRLKICESDPLICDENVKRKIKHDCEQVMRRTYERYLAKRREKNAGKSD